MAVSCMRNISGHNYRNSSFTVDVAMRQILRSTERISSFYRAAWNADAIYSDDNFYVRLSVRPSVSPSVCQTCAL